MKVAVFSGVGEYRGVVRVCHVSNDSDLDLEMERLYPGVKYIAMEESELPDPLTQDSWVISNGILTVI